MFEHEQIEYDGEGGGRKVLVFKEGTVREVPPRVPDAGETVWLHLADPSDADVHQWLGETFACHPLAIEDVLHFGQRAKLDHYGGHTEPHAFISFYAIDPDLQETEFCLLVSDQFIITVDRAPVHALRTLYARCPENPEWLSSSGGLLYRALDAVVDDYFAVIDVLENNLDDLEQKVFDHPEERVAPEIFRLKRRLHRARRWLSDGRNVIGMLAHESFSFTQSHQSVYFVDVYDHVSRIVDALDGVRDNLSGLLDLQTAQRANRMNEIMKTLTIFSTVFLPLSFIVGLYGMNFHDIPELGWSFGYVYVWIMMLAVIGAMSWYFKRKGWW